MLFGILRVRKKITHNKKATETFLSRLPVIILLLHYKNRYRTLLFLADLENKKLQIVALVGAPEDRVIRCLGAEFNLTQALMSA